jgi:hypothetical protein
LQVRTTPSDVLAPSADTLSGVRATYVPHADDSRLMLAAFLQRLPEPTQPTLDALADRWFATE